MNSAGATATTTAHITAGAAPSVPAAFAGDFQRKVTADDFAREASLDGYDAGTPPGVWTIHLMPNGLIAFDDPQGSGGSEIFTAKGSTLTVYGPANWLSPEDRRGGFCEAAPIDHYRWSVTGRTLTINGGRNCAPRWACSTARGPGSNGARGCPCGGFERAVGPSSESEPRDPSCGGGSRSG